MSDLTTDQPLESILPEVRGRYTAGAPLSRVTWFRVGGPAEVTYKPADVDDLRFFLSHKPADVAVVPIGVGSNVLVRDGGIHGVVVRLGRGFTNVAIHGQYVDVGAGVLDRTVAMIAAEEGLSGLEFLCSIPGTIGGALRMNAGCYGRDMADVVVAAFAVDPSGRHHTLTPEELGLTYRHSAVPSDWIFTGARLRTGTGDPATITSTMEAMLAAREDTQPIHTRTGGSTFANPDGHKAWELIDQAGCRGLTFGPAQVSEKHCNFLINRGGATAFDLESLGCAVQKRVLDRTGISLRWEIQRLGLERIPGTLTGHNGSRSVVQEGHSSDLLMGVSAA